MPSFFRVLDKFKPIYDVAYRVIMTLCKLVLIADILVTTWIVVSRYFPHHHPAADLGRAGRADADELYGGALRGACHPQRLPYPHDGV